MHTDISQRAWTDRRTRRLHAIDLENLTGGLTSAPVEFRLTWQRMPAGGCAARPGDHVVVGTSWFAALAAVPALLGEATTVS